MVPSFQPLAGMCVVSLSSWSSLTVLLCLHVVIHKCDWLWLFKVMCLCELHLTLNVGRLAEISIHQPYKYSSSRHVLIYVMCFDW